MKVAQEKDPGFGKIGTQRAEGEVWAGDLWDTLPW